MTSARERAWLQAINDQIGRMYDLTDYITPRKETTNVETKLKSPAQVEVDRLQADRDQLKKENTRLQDENKRLVESRSGKLALYIRLDGTTQIKPPLYGENGPARYYRQEVLRPGSFVQVSSSFHAFEPVSFDREEFRFIAETLAFYVYEQVR